MKNRNAKFKKLVAIVAGLFVFLPVVALAYTLLEPLPGGEGGVITQFSNLTDYLNWIFRFTLAAAAFLAVIKIVIGGMLIMTGGASESSVTKGKEMISMAIWGLILAISSVLILTTINPNLIKNSLDIPPTRKIESTTGGAGGKDGGAGGKIDCTNPPKIENVCDPLQGGCGEASECDRTTETQCGYAVWKCSPKGDVKTGGGDFRGGGKSFDFPKEQVSP